MIYTKIKLTPDDLKHILRRDRPNTYVLQFQNPHNSYGLIAFDNVYCEASDINTYLKNANNLRHALQHTQNIKDIGGDETFINDIVIGEIQYLLDTGNIKDTIFSERTETKLKDLTLYRQEHAVTLMTIKEFLHGIFTDTLIESAHEIKHIDVHELDKHLERMHEFIDINDTLNNIYNVIVKINEPYINFPNIHDNDILYNDTDSVYIKI